MSFLYPNIISGPIHSRRLGLSLGINLLPTQHKICNYNCIYCECGLNQDPTLNTSLADSLHLPTLEQVSKALENSLIHFKESKQEINSITFSGNGEPTLHPEFEQIVEEVGRLRTLYLGDVFQKGPKLTIISNASRIGSASVIEALKKADLCLLKLDAGTPEMYGRINRLNTNFCLSNLDKFSDKNMENNYNQLIENLHLLSFQYPFYIQTLFFRQKINGAFFIDNTQGKEWEAWLSKIAYIKPHGLMIYGLDRETPTNNLVKLSQKELESLATKIKESGIKQVGAYY
ncbi:MAG: radical SAM protein [Bacteroidales bacterium]